MLVKPQKIARPLNVSVEPPVTPVVEPCGKDCFILFNDTKGKSPAVGRHLFLLSKRAFPHCSHCFAQARTIRQSRQYQLSYRYAQS